MSQQGYDQGAPPGQFGAPVHNVRNVQSPPGQQGFGAGPPAPIAKNEKVAMLLEFFLGCALLTFGFGHIYAGRVGKGLAWMFGFWFVQLINIALMFVYVGIVTFFICWFAAIAIAPFSARAAIRDFNASLNLGSG